MMDAPSRIKNLSIALEAISRVNLKGSDILAEDITICLRKEIKTFQEEQDRPSFARPATPRSSTTNLDDIPF